MMNVEYEELIKRAVELEQPIGQAIPSEIPQPPCGLVMTAAAATVLGRGAAEMRGCLEQFLTVRQTLAQSLRNAAKAYRQVDEEGAHAISNLTPHLGAVMPDSVDAGSRRGMLGVDRPDPTKDEMIDGLHTVEEIALQIEQLDHGASLYRFADQWAKYKDALSDARKPFMKPFEYWEGQSADAVTANFQSQRRWLEMMMTFSGQLSSQSKTIADEFTYLRKMHVWATDLEDHKRKRLDYAKIVYLENFMKRLPGQFSFKAIIDWYRELTDASAQLISDFKGKSALPLTQVNPEPPPPAAKIKPPQPWKPVERPNDEDIQHAHNLKPAKRPTDKDISDAHILKPAVRPWIEGDDDVPVVPGGGGTPGGLPSMPSMPMMPMTPSTPNTNDPQLAEALKDLKGQGVPTPPHGGGMKPASFGGAGTPGTPLQAWGDDGATARAAGAGPGNPGRGVPGVGAAAPGGGMGGAAGQGGDKGGKGERVEGGEDEALYTEQRAWTEGVIGLRDSRAVPKQ
jgi:hypothetical protein